MSDDLLSDTPSAGSPSGGSSRRWFRKPNGGVIWRFSKWLALVLIVLAAFYYPVGMLIVHKINDDTAFAPSAVPTGASQTVAMAAALIDREVNHTGWPANAPWFMPSYMLDNMPNFQKGEILALQKFAIELRDQIGRARGTSSADPDLQDAASKLSNNADIWIFDLSQSWAPLTPSESYYRSAMRSLESYNSRLASQQIVFEPRADNLISTLDRIGKDLGDASAEIDTKIDQMSGAWIDWDADDKFYLIKGKVYAYSLLLRALGQDFDSVLKDKAANKAWDRMVNSLVESASLRPWVVINGRPDALMQPNHLAAEGFYLLRARAQLEELTDILQK